MDTGLGWEGSRLVVQRTDNHLTATLYIEKSGPMASKKEMGTSGCTEKCPYQFTDTLPVGKISASISHGPCKE